MKFIIVKEICHISDDRVVILKRNEDYFNRGQETTTIKYLCNAVIKVTEDWKLENEISVVDDTSSIQYRPKGIFGNNKGTVYLSKEEVDGMFVFMRKALDFLNPPKKS